MIPEPASLVLFAVATLALLLVPGPAVIYVVARSIQQGRRAGLASVLEIAGTARGVLGRSRRFVPAQRYVTGTVYVGLGVATALAGSSED